MLGKIIAKYIQRNFSQMDKKLCCFLLNNLDDNSLKCEGGLKIDTIKEYLHDIEFEDLKESLLHLGNSIVYEYGSGKNEVWGFIIPMSWLHVEEDIIRYSFSYDFYKMAYKKQIANSLEYLTPTYHPNPLSQQPIPSIALLSAINNLQKPNTLSALSAK